MPFTVSHVAAVLPAYRPLSRRQLFSAAIIGSMVPDFGMLLPVTFARWQTHSLSALFTFCLPVGLCAYALLQLLIKPAVMQIAPDSAYRRLCAEQAVAPPQTISRWLYVALIIVLGAATHLIWDGFTHEDAGGVRMFPVLEDYGPEMAGHPLQLYRWLQYGSSVFGLIVVFAALWFWLRHAADAGATSVSASRRIDAPERLFWIVSYVLLPLLAMLWVVSHLWLGHALVASGRNIGRIAIAGMRGAAVSLLLISALIRIRLTATN